jgi:plastocyanin
MPRDRDDVETAGSPLTPTEGDSRDVERFSSGARAHSRGLTEERSAQIVRQSANARSVAFLAVLLVTLFIPVYWFYESGIPALGTEGRMTAESRRLYGDGSEVSIAQPGTPGSPRVIELELTDTLEIIDSETRRKMERIAVKAGETVRFELDNTAGFSHNFFLGPQEGLALDETDDLPGVEAWTSGSRSFTWLVEADGPIRFACTVPGHYGPMNGPLVVG